MTISLLRINLSCNRADFQSANQIYGLSVHSGLVLVDLNIIKFILNIDFLDKKIQFKGFENQTFFYPLKF